MLYKYATSTTGYNPKFQSIEAIIPIIRILTFQHTYLMTLRSGYALLKNPGHSVQQSVAADTSESAGPQANRQDSAQDREMEAELAAGLTEDPLAAYDVATEGSAIVEYLQMIHEQELQHQQIPPC